MLGNKITVLAASAVALVSAASNYTVDPNSVSDSTKQTWCSSEINACEEVCNKVAGGPSEENTCSTSALTYNCTCTGGKSIDMSPYAGSLPAFACLADYGQCVNATDDASKQSRCKSDIYVNCGKKDPSKAGSSSTSSSTASGTSSSTSETSSSTSTSSPDSSDAMHVNSYVLGNAAVAAVVGLFAFML